MPAWSVQDDKCEALRRALGQRGHYGDENIAKAAKTSASSVHRILAGERVSVTTLRPVFACLLPRTDAPMTPERAAQLDSLMREYCGESAEAGRGRRHAPNGATREAPAASETGAEEQKHPALACMLLYVKFLHLRDRQTSAPVYHKFIPRLNQEIPVYDEFLMLRTMTFKMPMKGHKLYGRSTGVVDLLPVFPPRCRLIVNDMGSIGLPNVVDHLETRESLLSQAAFHYVNGFQRTQEELGFLVMEDCDQAVMAIDMTSLPVRPDRLLRADPCAYHIRYEEDVMVERRLDCSLSSTGAYLVDSRKSGAGAEDVAGWSPTDHMLLKNDKIEVRFSVDWAALPPTPAQSP